MYIYSYIHILVSLLQNNHFLRLLPVHRVAPRQVIFAPQKGMVMEERKWENHIETYDVES